ncbi:hypothetical protein Hanom_Chr08g00728951 [Helianthus anomalus]
MNVFDPKAGGAMIVASLPEGRPLWLDQIRGNILHPSNESLSLPLIDTPVVDPHVGVVDPSERRKKKREEKVEEKTAEDPVGETPRKRSSKSSFLDYVRDPDDDATVTEMMKKRKLLEDKKKELDAQAAAALSEKKSKLQKETTVAPSESEIDLGVFSVKTGNRLEKIFKSASDSRAPKSGHSVCKIDISKITTPTSPPSKPLDLSPPLPDSKGKGNEDDVEVEQVGSVLEDVDVGAGRGETHAEGVETEAESSEATP